MIGRAGSGRASARHTIDDDSLESRSILSFALLLSVIIAGFVISLTLAEANPTLSHALSTILN